MKIKHNHLLNKPVVIKIWGDWLIKRATEGIFKIKNIEQLGGKTVFSFENDKHLTIYSNSPLNVDDEKTFIAHADKVTFDFANSKNIRSPFHYQFERSIINQNILFSTNVDWHQPKYNNSIDSFAVELFFYK